MDGWIGLDWVGWTGWIELDGLAWMDGCKASPNALRCVLEQDTLSSA